MDVPASRPLQTPIESVHDAPRFELVPTDSDSDTLLYLANLATVPIEVTPTYCPYPGQASSASCTGPTVWLTARGSTPLTQNGCGPADLSLLDETIADRSRIHGPRQVTDLYLLALAVRHRGRFVTFDASVPLAVVRGAAPRNLTSI